MRLREKHLPHKIDITRLNGEGAEGDDWAEPVPDRPAYVEQKTRLVVDRRSGSPTAGQQIQADTFIVTLTKDEVLPRSLVTVWKGTPREREAEVIASYFADYKRQTPNHVELWLT